MTREEIENQIRRECDRQKITSTQAAVALQIAKTSYRAWKRGAWPLGDEKLQALAKLLGFEIEVEWKLKKL
jgi:transcriptional regulator with XRE-family HTH domain